MLMNNLNEINKIEKASPDRRESPEVENLGRVEKGTYEFEEKVEKKKKVTGVDVVAEGLDVADEVSEDEIKSPWSAGFQTFSKSRESRPNARIVDSNVWLEVLMRKIREKRAA